MRWGKCTNLGVSMTSVQLYSSVKISSCALGWVDKTGKGGYACSIFVWLGLGVGHAACKLFLPLRPWKVCSLSGVPSCHLLPAPSSWYDCRKRWQERPSSRVNDSTHRCFLGTESSACSWELEACKPAGSGMRGTALSGTPEAWESA